jgi:hypothetical protein
MKFHRRIDLTPAVRLAIAVQAIQQRGVWRAMTELARQYRISRQMVYLLRWSLLGIFEPDSKRTAGSAQDQGFVVSWDKLVLALRLHGCCSVGDIAGILTSMGLPKRSVGTISQFLGAIAKQVPNEVPQDEVNLILLADETFMAGRPILVLLDAKSHYILRAFLADDRSGQTWAELYQWAQEQGCNIEQVVADCGEGLRSGCRLAGLSHHPDLMHLITGFIPFLSRYERKAYQAIEHEYERKRVLESARSKEVLKKREEAYEIACQKTQEAIRKYEDFAYLWQCLLRAFDLFATDGALRTRSRVESEVAIILELMETQINDSALANVIRKFSKAVANYWPYFDKAERIYKELREQLPEDMLREICMGWQTEKKARACKDYQRKKALEKKAEDHLYLATCENLENAQQKASTAIERLNDNVRSSSPLEAVNSQIRDFLNSARGQLTQEMLNLITYFLNHKVATRGPYKGTSPYQRFTGQKEDVDCLDQLLEAVAQTG